METFVQDSDVEEDVYAFRDENERTRAVTGRRQKCYWSDGEIDQLLEGVRQYVCYPFEGHSF